MPTKVHRTIHERFRVNVKALREKQGLSQPAMAAIMGINAEYYGQMERGFRNPSLEMMEIAARALDVDVSRLIKEVA